LLFFYNNQSFTFFVYNSIFYAELFSLKGGANYDQN